MTKKNNKPARTVGSGVSLLGHKSVLECDENHNDEEFPPCLSELSRSRSLGGELTDSEKEKIKIAFKTFQNEMLQVYRSKSPKLSDADRLDLIISATAAIRVMPSESEQENETGLITDDITKSIEEGSSWVAKLLGDKHKIIQNEIEEQCAKVMSSSKEETDSCCVCGKEMENTASAKMFSNVNCLSCGSSLCGSCAFVQRASYKQFICQKCEEKTKNQQDSYYYIGDRIPMTSSQQQQMLNVSNTGSSGSDTESEQTVSTDEDILSQRNTDFENEIIENIDIAHMALGIMAVLGSQLQKNTRNNRKSLSDAMINIIKEGESNRKTRKRKSSSSGSKKPRRKRKISHPSPLHHQPNQEDYDRHRDMNEFFIRNVKPTIDTQKTVMKREDFIGDKDIKVKKDPDYGNVTKGTSGRWQRSFRCTKDDPEYVGSATLPPNCKRIRWKKDIIGSLEHVKNNHGMGHIDWELSKNAWICKTDNCNCAVSILSGTLTHEELMDRQRRYSSGRDEAVKHNSMNRRNMHESDIPEWEMQVLAHMRKEHHVYCIVAKDEDETKAQTQQTPSDTDPTTVIINQNYHHSDDPFLIIRGSPTATPGTPFPNLVSNVKKEKNTFTDDQDRITGLKEFSDISSANDSLSLYDLAQKHPSVSATTNYPSSPDIGFATSYLPGTSEDSMSSVRI